MTYMSQLLFYNIMSDFSTLFQKNARCPGCRLAHCGLCYRLPSWHAYEIGLLYLYVRVTALRVPLTLIKSRDKHILSTLFIVSKKQYSKSDVNISRSLLFLQSSVKFYKVGDDKQNRKIYSPPHQSSVKCRPVRHGADKEVQ